MACQIDSRKIRGENMKTINMLLAKWMYKYRRNCESVATLKAERANAKLDVATAKIKIARIKIDPEDADWYVKGALHFLNKAIKSYEEALERGNSWSYLGPASFTGKFLSCILFDSLLLLAVMFVSGKIVELVGLPMNRTPYYITLAITSLVMAVPAGIGFSHGLLHDAAMKIKIARLKSLRTKYLQCVISE